MVERTAHNGLVVGSNPAKPKILQEINQDVIKKKKL